MRALVPLLLAALPTMPAFADTLVASRPGMMCQAADALARLTKPDGSSRASAPNASPNDLAIARQGGCIPIPNGARVAVQSAHVNTSVVLFDPGDGSGPRTYIAPNIDFASSGNTPPAEKCLGYNVPVTLTGRISIGSAYGEDPHTGHLGTARWQQITLDRPICTRADAATYADAEQDIRALQPVWESGPPPDLKTGQPVTATGTLFHQDNANQMTKVLITVTQLTVH